MKIAALLFLFLFLIACTSSDPVKVHCQITEYSMQEDYSKGIDQLQVVCRDGQYIYKKDIILDCTKNNQTENLSYECVMKGY